LPADLTVPCFRYRTQVLVVLVSLLVFFLLYVSFVASSAYLVYWSITFPIPRLNFPHGNWVAAAAKLGAIGGSVVLFLFPLKGLFKQHQADPSLLVEVAEAEQPELFAFLRLLCDETGAPFPRRVFVSPEVNAEVFYHSSLLSLIRPTRKNLIIGLGLVNVVNLSEFKAVLAHEFGHFSQKGMKLGAYVYTSNLVIADMVYARDWFDDLLVRLRGSDPWLAIFVGCISAVVEVLRKILEILFRAINLCDLALSRQMEFQADLVAVSVTGSDAPIHCLARCDFAKEALDQAAADLSAAAAHQLYSRDLFYHQNHAAEYLRRVRKAPHLGEPPPLAAQPGPEPYVFQPEDDGASGMWATHPSNFDREQNAKRRYFRSAIDDRSPWLLFHDAAAVRRKVTRRFYRVALKLGKGLPLGDPEPVQAFIDDEHAETTYDPRYHGVYDGRILEPGEVEALVQEAAEEPWEPGRLLRDQTRLYDEQLREWMEAHQRRQREYARLARLDQVKDFDFRGRCHRPGDAKRLLKQVEAELEEDRQSLVSLDRKVFLVHYQMGRQLDGGRPAQELVARYKFHREVRTIVRHLSEQLTYVESADQFLAGRPELTPEQFDRVLGVLQRAHDVLSDGLSKAYHLRLPALRNVQAGEPLKPLLLVRRLIYPPGTGDGTLNGKWVSVFMEQLEEVRDRAQRIHFKSLGGMLALQEQIRARWRAEVAAAPEDLPAEPQEGWPTRP
jgi:Zn-dependent protease with chaperone function